MENIEKMRMKEILSLEKIKPCSFFFDYLWPSLDEIPEVITLEDAIRQSFGVSELNVRKTIASAVRAIKEKNYTSIDDERKVGYFDYRIENPKGTLFILPGGGYWNICAYEEGFVLADIANRNGFSAFVVSYGVRDYAKQPGPILDLGNVIKHVYANLDTDITEDYEIVGCSASGHLCAMFAEKEHGYLSQGIRKPKKVILMYPVIDFGPKTHLGSKINSLKEKVSDIEAQDEYSAQLHVDGDFPPTYISRGYADQIVPIVNTDMFVSALNKAGVKNKIVVVNRNYHGYAAAWEEDGTTWFSEALNWNE